MKHMPLLAPLLAGVCVIAVALVSLLLQACGSAPPSPVRIETLDAWVDFSRRPGFELLDKAGSDDYFVAVYRTKAGELAFCYRWRGDGDAPSTSLAVRDEEGGQLREGELSDATTPLNPTGPLPAGGFVDGMVVPIRKHYTGQVMLDFRDNRAAPDSVPAREVYRKALAWGR